VELLRVYSVTSVNDNPLEIKKKPPCTKKDAITFTYTLKNAVGITLKFCYEGRRVKI